ncbi:MAG: itaconate CoA-transferase [Chloroflexota bacterium]|jgi:crotonobetainyl-CoA:carnitine CoA-transferase CaiB-like acyl-CoA transferase|nr:itaconate CoA-transferase [Chloroflexota bacterium]
MAEGALTGIKVLAFEQAAAGPFGTHLLADMGAEVIKIEAPTGDVVRTWDNVVHGNATDPKDYLSSGYTWLSRRKKSVTVNTRNPTGLEILRRLASQADVFLVNAAPGLPDRLGLGWETLHELNPRLVYCSLTGYGMTGPYKDMKAYDLLIQGESGILLSNGYPEAPAKVGVPISDIAAGMYAALGITMALYQRERSGVGQLVDVAMFETMLEWLGYFPQHYWHSGALLQRVGMRHHFVVPYGVYLARDGKYINVVVASPRDWEMMCRDVVERPDLLQDPKYATSPLRRENRVELEKTFEDVFATRDSVEWLARLKKADLPFGEVRDVDEVLAHPQVGPRGLIREVDSPLGPLPTIETALRLSESPVQEGPIPSLGGNTDEVLRDAGYTEDEIKRFHAEGAV